MFPSFFSESNAINIIKGSEMKLKCRVSFHCQKLLLLVSCIMQQRLLKINLDLSVLTYNLHLVRGTTNIEKDLFTGLQSYK